MPTLASQTAPPALKIAVISKADHFGGGASRVAAELTALLNGAGLHADHWLSWAGGSWSPHMRPLYGRLQFPIRAANFGLRKVGFPELIPFELGPLLYGGRILDYDLLHFHDLSSAISPLTLLYLSRKRPVAWTIHDCSPFTGGCLYPMGCQRFAHGCGACPQLGEWPIDSKLDFTGFQQGIKRRLARSGRIQYVTPSTWMRQTALASGMFAVPPAVLHNGVDTAVFRPFDKAAVRRELGLPGDRTIVLLSAGSLLDERKGTRYAIEALQACRDLRPFILLVGNSSPQVRDLLAGFDIHEAGYLGDSERLARHYAAANLFLFTSLADNQPLTVLETMATGTPIVGFETGGIPEMVLQDKTGRLVAQKDTQALTTALRQVLTAPGVLTAWGERGRAHIEKLFSHRHFLDTHLALYHQMLARPAKAA